MDELITKLGITNYVLFMQDYGGPVGFRMALAHPERVRAVIIQNAVSHEQGLSPLWEARRKYWADPAHELANLKANFTSFEATRQRHIGSSPRPRSVRSGYVDRRVRLSHPSGPGRYPDHAVPGLPDQRRLLSALAKLASRGAAADPGGLGKYDPSFTVAGATAYAGDVPKAEIHILEAGHFALDEATDRIASLVRDFLGRLALHKKHG